MTTFWLFRTRVLIYQPDLCSYLINSQAKLGWINLLEGHVPWESSKVTNTKIKTQLAKLTVAVINKYLICAHTTSLNPKYEVQTAFGWLM